MRRLVPHGDSNTTRAHLSKQGPGSTHEKAMGYHWLPSEQVSSGSTNERGGCTGTCFEVMYEAREGHQTLAIQALVQRNV